MNKIILLSVFFFFFNCIHSQNTSEKATIEITIENIKYKKGTIKICATKQPEQFLKNMEYCQSIPIKKKGQLTTIFKKLPFGKYAFVIYHDKNNNGHLDLGLLKIPKEPYGFSNNPSTMFGPPNFEKASININQEKLLITIKL